MAELCQYSNSDCCRWENGCLSMVKLFIAPSPGELRMIPPTNMCGKCNKIHKHKILGNCPPTPPLKERFSPSSCLCQLWLRGGVGRHFFLNLHFFNRPLKLVCFVFQVKVSGEFAHLSA